MEMNRYVDVFKLMVPGGERTDVEQDECAHSESWSRMDVGAGKSPLFISSFGGPVLRPSTVFVRQRLTGPMKRYDDVTWAVRN
jgi:hypothetical protein